MKPRQIFTLDARDNCMLEVLTQDIDRTSIYNFINKTFDEMVLILEQKDIKYTDLKNSLIPQNDKREIAFVFNRLDIDSGWYGNDVFNQVIPLLNNESSHSILAGDMVGFEKHNEKIKKEFLNNLVKVRDFEYITQHQFYLVYLNNLTDGMVDVINTGLLKYKPYVGFLELTHGSFMKTYLSMTLSNCYLKLKRTVISGHEPDRDNDENVNMYGYNFEENGYTCKSISDDYYGLFLSYKIERQTFPNEKDTGFSINALTDDIHQFPDLDIVVEENKLGYLLKEKASNLKRAELHGLNTEELAKVIKSKIELNYIYNLTYLAEHDILKFNVMFDMVGTLINKQVKVVASFEYQPKSKALRLITLF